MKVGAVGAGVVAWVGAALSALCCLLPLAVIVLGLGSGAFMAVTMRYRWFLIPAGIVGVVTGFVLYVRERRRCDALGCRMAGSRLTLGVLVVASLVVTTSIVLDRFPEFTSDLLARVMSGHAPHTSHDMGGTPMNRWARVLPLFLGFVLVASAALAATSTVVLNVDGMTWGTWSVAVKKALEGRKGVRRAEVNFREKAARVMYDPAQVGVDRMIEAVQQLGFRASLKSPGER